MHFEFSYFFFVLIHLETIRFRSSLKNHTQFQTKIAKCIPIFRPKRPKTLPVGAAHTYMAYIREYPPPPPRYLPIFFSVVGVKFLILECREFL